MEDVEEARPGQEKASLGGELARAYVPVQAYTRTLTPPEGWRQGSIFPELIRPYTPAPRRPRRLR